jgi:hypothetical protein
VFYLIKHFNTPTHQHYFNDPQRLNGAQQMIKKMEDSSFRMRAWEIVKADYAAKDAAAAQAKAALESVALSQVIATPSSPRWEVASGWQEMNCPLIAGASWSQQATDAASIACRSMVDPFVVTLVQGVTGDLHAWKFHSMTYYDTEKALLAAMIVYAEESAMRVWPILVEDDAVESTNRGAKLQQLRRNQLSLPAAASLLSDWLRIICPLSDASNAQQLPLYCEQWKNVLEEMNEGPAQLDKWHTTPTWMCVRHRV